MILLHGSIQGSTVNFDPHAGSSIEYVAAEACNLANTYKINVNIVFNGVEILCKPHMCSVEGVVKTYLAAK